MKNLVILLLVLCCFSCTDKKKSDIILQDANAFSTVVDGKDVALYTLKSENGITMQVTNFGGRVVSLWVPDKNGKFDDIVLGHTDIEQYIHSEGERFLGCVVGRYANRIAKGQFVIDGITYQLPLNNNGQTLHGGLKGLDLVVWDVDTVSENMIQLSYNSLDGEEGFPGTMKIKMVYALTPENELKIAYEATTDKPTIVNLSHHGFFNLKGEGNGTTNDHILTIYADSFIPVDSVLIPTGEIAPVEGTPFDFRIPIAIGERVATDNPQLKYGMGYDHNWVLNRKTGKDVELAASVYEPASGRFMEVFTDQPGIQFYGGNFFEGTGKGKYGKTQNYRESIALETQHFPDSPNHPDFPSTQLNPGEVYTQTCIYKFSIK